MFVYEPPIDMARSTRAEVRNPLLRLKAMRELRSLPRPARLALASMLRELAREADASAERAWKQRKAPMAAYWRAVCTYAKHTARAIAK